MDDDGLKRLPVAHEHNDEGIESNDKLTRLFVIFHDFSCFSFVCDVPEIKTKTFFWHNVVALIGKLKNLEEIHSNIA